MSGSITGTSLPVDRMMDSQTPHSTSPRSNAWAKPVSPSQTSSLADVMSEQLVSQLHNSDKKHPGRFALVSEVSEKVNPADFQTSLTEEEQNDAMIAQMLQYELDLEHDEMIQRKERHYNGPSKVSVSMVHHRRLHPSESHDELDPIHDFPEPDMTPGKLPQIGARGYIGKGKDIVTKHDADICGRRNADRVMANFPPNFATGDDFLHDSKIPNKIFNELKVHSLQQDRRGHRVKDKKDDVATATMAVDPRTRLILFKMVSGEVLKAINGVVATGKESVVLHAVGGTHDHQPLPEECAIKVYKTTLNEFRNRGPYIRNDYRFQERFSKLNPRKIVRFWAEKEMLNLKRMTENDIPCPKPLLLRKHVLVMEFLGTHQTAAPRLKDAVLSPQLRKRAYEETCQIMRRMYTDCRLIHADFSEYNLIWHDDRVWVIDVSQSVEPAHPRALEFLYRDCSNVYNFFSRSGVEVLSIKDLFKSITNIELEGSGQDLIAEFERLSGKSKEKPHKFDADVEKANFDYLYLMAEHERERASEDHEDDWEIVDDDEDESDTDSD
ncbi:hypothetical protein RvY_15724 [Ramazzottius varieornatus]|uniref:Serine/threonine-protein kinase RIO3 n=1 Tax=Ramazzottius varieornatus TaxID=947166 RepID=A0A1D1W2M8_RAMVA|nr:hypothetical protein RvY_15724 [Ramazzottius varieornatus]